KGERPVKLLHDNAKPHIASSTKDTIMSLGWNVLQHSAYSSDIAPSDYHLFWSMQHALSDMHFQSVDDIRKWLDHFIVSEDVTFFRDGIYQLPGRWLKVIESNGEYF
ncbi:Histone-lysine N-methyltransferase SETMAR, partial [Harpegnathos saltator]